MRLPRPHIPLGVRLQVAQRQLLAADVNIFQHARREDEALGGMLARLLDILKTAYYAEHLQLDHDPALALRKFNKRTGKYKPDANDPAYLKYRPTDDHRTKTFIRGEHGQRSDSAQITRERRRLRPKKPKRKIPQRKNPWPPKGSRKVHRHVVS